MEAAPRRAGRRAPPLPQPVPHATETQHLAALDAAVTATASTPAPCTASTFSDCRARLLWHNTNHRVGLWAAAHRAKIQTKDTL
eukprot:1791163-Pleurochrysis_carterae.AAC.1